MAGVTARKPVMICNEVDGVQVLYNENTDLYILNETLEEMERNNDITYIKPVSRADARHIHAENLGRCGVALMLMEQLNDKAEGLLYSVGLAGAKQDCRDDGDGENTRTIVGVYASEQKYNQMIKKGKLPDFLRREPLFLDDIVDFKKKLRNIYQEGPELMKQLYPYGKVGQGLAANYFKIVCTLLSEGMNNKYKKKLEELNKNPARTLKPMEKNIIAIPMDCTLKMRIDVKDYGGAFTKLHDFDLTSSDAHGIDRKYTHAAYEVEVNNDVYLVRVEFPNIVTTLDKMTRPQTVKFEPISQDEMKEQRRDFIKEFTDLLDVWHRNKYVLINFHSGEDLNKQIRAAVKQENEENNAEPIAEREMPAATVYCADGHEDDEEFNVFVNALKTRVNLLLVKPTEKESDARGKVSEIIVFLWISDGKLPRGQSEKASEHMYHEDNAEGSQKYRRVWAILSDGEPIKGDHEQYFQGSASFTYRAPEHRGCADFMEKIEYVCTNRIPLNFPLGEVYQGLVWATVLNLLKAGFYTGKVHKMREAWKKLKATDKSLEDAVFFDKVILLSEKQCRDLGGTVQYISIGFKSDDRLTPHLNPIGDTWPLGERIKEAALVGMGVNEPERIIVERQEAKAGESVRVKVTLLRNKPTENNYESNLHQKAVKFADDIEMDGFKMNLAGDPFKVTVDIKAKSFEDFEGVTQMHITEDITDKGMTTQKVITTASYKIEYKKKTYVVCAEFVRAITALREIQMLIPVNEHTISHQRGEFNRMFQKQILKTDPEVENLCDLFCFDIDNRDDRSTDGKNELQLNKILAEFVDEREDKLQAAINNMAINNQ